MVKKITAALFAFAIILCAFMPTADAAAQRVFDYAALFSSTEARQLEQRATEIREEYGYDIVILTSYDVEYSSSDAQASKLGMAYADDFYDQNGFGVGSDNSGFVFFIDMNNRMPTISTCGGMIDILTDSRLDAIFNECAGSLSYGDYAGAVNDALDELEYFIKKGVPEGQVRYDSETGEILTSPHLRLETDEIIIACVAALAVSLIFIGGKNSSYKLKGSTYTYDASQNTSIVITNATDDYVTTRVTRTPRVESSGGGGGGGFGGGGSGVHSSGGGVSHGGGSGGRF